MKKITKRITEYDERGNRINETNYTEDGDISLYTEYEYNAEDEVTKRTQYQYGKITGTKVYEYSFVP